MVLARHAVLFDTQKQEQVERKYPPYKPGQQLYPVWNVAYCFSIYVGLIQLINYNDQ